VMANSLRPCLDKGMEISFHGHRLILDGRRALFMPQNKWLLFADAHWGKTHFFQKHGLSVGHGVFQADLKRLTDLIDDYRPEMLLCLGDLIHHEQALNGHLKQAINLFRQQNPIPMALIRGNHERFIPELPFSWGIDIIESHLERDGLILCHEKEDLKGPQIYGHLHPKMTLKAQGDHLSLPCFYQVGDDLVLPAFSEFCGGVNIELEPKKNQRAYLCLDETGPHGTHTEVVSIP
jgi:DNA ligase-associated metallophosphoesterase